MHKESGNMRTLTWKFALILSLLGVLPVHAQNTLPPHEEQLARLQGHIHVSITPGFNFFERVQAINHLHETVFNSDLSHHFGPEALVRSVELRKLYSSDENQEQESAFISKLRGHHISYAPTRGTMEALRRQLPLEAAIYTAITELELSLLFQFENLKIERSGNYVTKIVSTNESYLRVLQSLQRALAKIELYEAFDSMEKITFTDSSESFGGISFERRSRLVDEEVKEQLTIHVGRPWTSLFDLEFHEDMIGQGLEMLFVMKFKKVSSLLLELQEAPGALNALYERLTPANIARLQALGVTNFHFSSNWRNAAELLNRGTLTLGWKAEDIDQIFAYYIP